EARSKEYLAWMKEIGRVVPVHYQEPFRRDFGAWQPRAEDYVADLKGAIAGGAAGWCLHYGANGAALDRRPRRSRPSNERPRQRHQPGSIDHATRTRTRLLGRVFPFVVSGVFWTSRAPHIGVNVCSNGCIVTTAAAWVEVSRKQLAGGLIERYHGNSWRIW